jgi:hypothetical protein
MADHQESATPDLQKTSVSELLADAQQLWSNTTPKPTSPSEGGLPASDEEFSNSSERNAANRVQDLFQQIKNASADVKALFLLFLSPQMPDSQNEFTGGGGGASRAAAANPPLQRAANGSGVQLELPVRVVKKVIPDSLALELESVSGGQSFVSRLELAFTVGPCIKVTPGGTVAFLERHCEGFYVRMILKDEFSMEPAPVTKFSAAAPVHVARWNDHVRWDSRLRFILVWFVHCSTCLLRAVKLLHPLLLNSWE